MRIEVTCSKCGRKFWMEDYESKPCPNCGKVAVGPKAKSSSGGCLITEACIRSMRLSHESPEISILKRFRDEYLLKNEEGKKLIKEYYKIAPIIIEEVEKKGNSDEVFKEIFNEIGKIVLMIEEGKKEDAIAYYKKVFLKLQQKYLPSNFSGGD